MNPPDRIVRILYVKDVGILASDTYGRVHLLDQDLRLVASSPFVRRGRPLYGLTVADGWVIGKDRMGSIRGAAKRILRRGQPLFQKPDSLVIGIRL